MRGEVIENKSKYIPNSDWVEAPPSWEFPAFVYRIKPKEVKMVPHWPAVYESRDCYYLSDRVFHEDAPAKKEFGDSFIRLAGELPAIFLEVKE